MNLNYCCIFRAASCFFKELHRRAVYFFIDEFQDYAEQELNLLKRVFPQAIFNLFGDIKQSTSSKGLREADIEMVVNAEWYSFVINENYRNAREITEYVNRTFNMNMLPIGISGTVHCRNIKDFKITLPLGSDDRIALIMNNTDDLKLVADRLAFEPAKINILTDDTGMIIKGALNVIPVDLAKGLEFERVYVLQEGMTENQKYIAYTRALNSLFILD